MNPYQSMYVLPKSQYQALIASPPSSTNQAQSSAIKSRLTNNMSLSSNIDSPSTQCHVCGRDFIHPNILAHHLKSHVNGFKCNICSKSFKSKPALHEHLIAHEPQIEIELDKTIPKLR